MRSLTKLRAVNIWAKTLQAGLPFLRASFQGSSSAVLGGGHFVGCTNSTVSLVGSPSGFARRCSTGIRRAYIRRHGAMLSPIAAPRPCSVRVRVVLDGLV
jgi:hypothetical protein